MSAAKSWFWVALYVFTAILSLTAWMAFFEGTVSGRLQGRFPYGLIRVHAGHGGGLGGCAGWRLLAGAGM
jgi:hypothetical protein